LSRKDPRIATAFERFQQMIDTPGYVFDRANMLNVFFFANAVPLGDEDCLMHKQASFFAFGIQDFGYDLDEFATFKFPAVNDAYGDAAMGGGNHMAALNDRNVVRQLTRIMVSQRFGREALAETGGWILPNIRFDTSLYPDGEISAWAETVQAALAADQFRFDASDLMPTQVGAGTFWASIRDLVAGIKAIPQISRISMRRGRHDSNSLRMLRGP